MASFVSLFLIVALSYEVYGGWEVTLSEDFNQNTLNTTLWNTFYSYAPQTINSELEYYMPDAFSFSNSIDGTLLRIVGLSNAPFSTEVGSFNFTSGLITTRHKFTQQYGYFEMRSRHPIGNGFWPAFWLDNEDGSVGEIDVMEMIMNLPNNVYTTFHCNYSSNGGIGKETVMSAGYGSGFHTYGLQWIPGQLFWYVDGVQIFNISSACIPNKPAFIMANMAIGGSWPGPPTDLSLFPAYMDIDYIRVYKYVGGGLSITGPGNGISYTPITDAQPMFTIGQVQVTPSVASPGQVVTITAVVSANPTQAISNVIVQFPIRNLSSSITVTQASSRLNVPAGSSGSVTASYTVPSDHGTGFIWVGIGFFNSSYGNYLWENTAAVFKVVVPQMTTGSDPITSGIVIDSSTSQIQQAVTTGIDETSTSTSTSTSSDDASSTTQAPEAITTDSSEMTPVTSNAPDAVTSNAASVVTSNAPAVVTSYSIAVTTGFDRYGNCNKTADCPTNSKCVTKFCKCNTGYVVEGVKCVEGSSKSDLDNASAQHLQLSILLPALSLLAYYLL